MKTDKVEGKNGWKDQRRASLIIHEVEKLPLSHMRWLRTREKSGLLLIPTVISDCFGGIRGRRTVTGRYDVIGQLLEGESILNLLLPVVEVGVGELLDFEHPHTTFHIAGLTQQVCNRRLRLGR